MAKKIRLDFTKVEERSGWNTRAMPDGLHQMKIESVQVTEANDGTDMLIYALRPTAAKYKTRLFPFYCKLQANQFWKLRDLATAAGMTIPKKVVNFDPESPVGKLIAAEVEEEVGQYAGRSQVQATYGLDILDGDDDASADDDTDDEEYEGEEEEVEETDEEEHDEEDEEDEEDLNSLTIGELRKRAKGLGIDTDGVKKAELIELILEEEEGGSDEEDEDEDDLDDEDLDDEELEDFEDEEDEEAPAPRRKAAPAKKPAAKAAPAARRTVKRR